MEKAVRRPFNRWVIGGVIIVMLCCFVPVSYMTIREIEGEICYRRIASELNVAPTYEAISAALYAQVDGALYPGMDREQVIAALEQIAPVATHNEGPTFGGGFVEFTMLKICFFSTSDVTLLIYYSYEGKFREAILYFND